MSRFATVGDGQLADQVLREAPAILLLLDNAGRIARVNTFFEQLTGWSLAEVRGRDWITTFLPERCQERIRGVLEQAVAGQALSGVINPILTRSGGEREIEWHNRVFEDPHTKERGVLALGLDVTERLATERALRKREAELERSGQQLREAQRLAKVGNWELDVVNNTLVWSEEIFRIFEMDPTRFQASYEAFLDAIHPDDRELVNRAFTTSVANRTPYQIIHRLRMSDGRIKWVHERGETSYDEAGEPFRTIGTVQDISEQVVAERALEDSRSAYRRLHEALRLKDDAIHESITAIAFADLAGTLSYANPAFLRMWGYASSQEVIGRSVLDFMADREAAAEALRKVLSGAGFSGEMVARRHDGSDFLALLSASLLRNDVGAPIQIMGSFIDVTEHRRADQEVRRTRDLLRAVIDSSPDWIFAKDFEHRFVLVNKAFASALGLTPPRLVGHLDSEFFPVEQCEGDADQGTEGFHHDDRRAFRGETIHNPYDPATAADGKKRIFDTVKEPLRDASGQVYGVLGYSRDVTMQRESAAAQERALAEKETLLREIHHRVKNNLQIISSLLHFQAKKARTPEDSAVFAEGRNRLLAMMLVHEKLYQSVDLTHIDFADYVRSLVRSLGLWFESRSRVRVEISADDLELSTDLALAGGMMVCELITNCFKYAFPHERKGRVQISIRGDAHAVTLQVDDDGVGFSVGFTPDGTDSFGFHLMSNLAQQHGATIEAYSHEGAHVRVVFPRSVCADSTPQGEPRSKP